MNEYSKIDGLIPEALRPRTRKVVLEDYQLPVDIGFTISRSARPSG
jgi:hypothetical protein